MDILDEEIVLLWKALDKHRVKYIMVGGFATNLHGFSRITADVDIWLEDSSENRKGLRDAITDLGIGDFPQLETLEFIPGWTTIMLDSGFELDIMTELKGFGKKDFLECYKIAPRAQIYEVLVPFLHISHLIEEKKANGRPKDLLDLEELLKIQKGRM